MGKRGKKLLISYEDRLEEIKKHNIFDDEGKIKKLSDPVWSVICDNLNKNQLTVDTYIHSKNLQSYVLRNVNRIKLDLNKSESTFSTEVKCSQSKQCDVYKIEKSLILISNNVLYKPIVQELSFYPFSICHGATIAISFVSDLTDKSNFIFTSIGSFCKSFISPDTNLYLYSFGTIFLNQFIPVCQISCERISVSMLNSFFNKLLMNGLPIPHQVTVHHSWILYTSINASFNVNVSYEDYLNLCFKYLTEDNALLPRCVINTDVKLLLLKVKKWDCVQKKKLDSVRLFYLYCVIVLSKQYDVEKFQDFLQKIFVVTYSQTRNEHTTKFFKDILTEIKNHQIDTTYNKKNIEELESTFGFILEFENNTTKYIDYSKCSIIYKYLINTFAKAKQYVTGDDGSDNKNAFYNPDFCKLLIQISMEFILWTKVMLKNYDSQIEENQLTLVDCYKEAFRGHLDKKIPDIDITVDVYLLENIEYVNHMLENAISSIETKKMKKIEQFNPEISHMYHEENWGGLNKQKELECSSSSNEDSEDSDISDQNEISSEDECNNNEIEFSGINVSTLITSICETVQNDNLQKKVSYENKKKGTNLDAVAATSNENIVKPTMSSFQDHGNMDMTFVNFEDDPMISTSSPHGVQKKRERSILLAQVSTTLDGNLSQLYKKDVSLEITSPTKGQNKRGKYLQPCKEIHLLNQKPLMKPKKRKIIKNYNEFVPKKINGVRQIIKTSSYFDCIIEILTTAYYTVQAFQDFLNSSCSKVNKGTKHEFLAVVYDYVTTFNTRSLYSSRVSIIANICKANTPCYTWTRSIGEFYGELLDSTIYKQFSCESCNIDTYEHDNRINLKREQVVLNQDLSSIVYDSLQEGNECYKCRAKLKLKKVEIRNILCIDIEHFRNCTTNNIINSIQLNEVISTITINKKTLILIGIVVYEEGIKHTDSRHYIAYCRSIEGFWYEYNDSISRNRVPKVQDNLKVNIALLFYVEVEVPKV